ncbi:DUF2637 domain-containing protein [Streptomyces buecherae]|uniref:DUF2637 domain-containing protein n=1 Tax=Streptomyces buecherae TaxID=2763006 RepID=UPI0027E1F025|nr:DUF2637 domain-containing protein [Streptomyces buecherae]
MQLTRTHRILIGVIIAGAAVIAAIGFVGSYAAVRDLAQEKGFGSFANVFPIGIDAGIVVLLALDLLLTWIRIPFPLLRQTAWLLTAATIAFNGAAAWPDPLGVGMHAVIPVLFVVAVEAARHAIGRIADITADRHMESVRVARWLLAPVPTFRLWRRMKLWELRSYNEVIRLEQDRLVYRARLRARFGRAWRRKAPVESLMPLRLARYGVPISQTAPAGLAAAGIVIPPEMALATGEATSGAVEPAAAIEAAGTVERADAKADAGAATAVGAGQRGLTAGAAAPAALAQAVDASQAPKASDEARAANAARAAQDAQGTQAAQGAPEARDGSAAKAAGPGPVNGVSTRKNEAGAAGAAGAAGTANGTNRANGSQAAAAPQATGAPRGTDPGDAARAAQAAGAPAAAHPAAAIPAPRAAHAGAHPHAGANPEAGARPEAGAGREAAAAGPAAEAGREAGDGAGGGGPEAGVATEGVGPDGGPVTVPVGSGGRRRTLGNAQYVGYPAVAGGYADERPYAADPQASTDPQAAAARAAAAQRAERPAPYDDRHPDQRQQSGHPHDRQRDQQRAGDGRRPDGAGDPAREMAARDQRAERRPAQAPEFPPDATQEIALSALPELSTLPDDVPRDEAFYGAFRRFVTEHGAFPDSRQFSRYLLDHYGIAGVGGGPMPAHGLRREIRELRERYRMEMETEHIP